MSYLDLLRLTLTEAALVVTALVVIGVDLAMRERRDISARSGLALSIGLVGCLAGIIWLLTGAPDGDAGGGMFVSNPMARLVKAMLLALTCGTLLMSWRIQFTQHVGEYVSILLLGAVGMMLIASAENVLMMFLALELASLSLYILAGFDKRDPKATEAALKYFLFGGMAGAFLLFGLSFLYGATGAIDFKTLSTRLGAGPMSPLVLAGLVMVFVGLGFKIAAAPFHFWAPDAYEGAPTPAAGFIAAGSKLAALFIIVKFTVSALGGVVGTSDWGAMTPGWSPLLAMLAALSMLWGNLAAISQRNLKRLLAYSAIAHAGYNLVAIVGGGAAAIPAVTFYAATYALTTLGAFGVIGWLEKTTGGSDIEHIAGLSRRSPAMALAFAVFLLSLAGIPPLVGFFGKLYLFLVALRGGGASLGLLWLIGLGAATTCISFYYYLKVLKAVFVSEPEVEYTRSGGAGPEVVTIGLVTVLVVLLGCAPGLLLSPLQQALAVVSR